MKPTDRQINSRIVFAVCDKDGNIDPNRIFRHSMYEHAMDLASGLSEETKERWFVIPIILK